MGTQSLVAEAYDPGLPRQWASAILYLPGISAPQAVRYDVVGGMAVYEGDILLGPVSAVMSKYGVPPRQRYPSIFSAVAVADDSYLWPGGTIPYEIAPDVSAAERSDVEWAVAHVSSQTVLKMLPRSPTTKDYVVFTESGGGATCSSYLGRSGGAQPILLKACGRGGIVHEIGHAVGLHHEHSRSDRDSYVTIAWPEISPSYAQWFEKTKGTVDIGAYDYNSIMHYSRRAFSASGKDTIIPKDPNAKIGQRDGLSALDIAGIAVLYSGANPQILFPPVLPPIGPTAGFAGAYSSNRGDVSCTESGATVNCSYPGGSLYCAASGEQLDCAWSGGGQGRATFTRQSNGNLLGTYGDLLSNSGRGPWVLVRGTTVPASFPGTLPGLPTLPGIPGVPQIPGLPGVVPTSPAP